MKLYLLSMYLNSFTDSERDVRILKMIQCVWAINSFTSTSSCKSSRAGGQRQSTDLNIDDDCTFIQNIDYHIRDYIMP